MPDFKTLLIYKILREIKNSYSHLLDFFLSTAERIIIITREHLLDKKLGIETFEPCYEKDTQSFYKDGLAYFPSSYSILEKVVKRVELSKDDVVVDMGCGKGRVVFFMAMEEVKRVIGVEIRRDTVEAAKVNFSNFKYKKSPLEIINADVINFNPKEGTVFFFFNPFGYRTFDKVIENIKNSLITNPRKIKILYYNATYSFLLDSQDWLSSKGEIGDTKVFLWESK